MATRTHIRQDSTIANLKSMFHDMHFDGKPLYKGAFTDEIDDQFIASVRRLQGVLGVSPTGIYDAATREKYNALSPVDKDSLFKHGTLAAKPGMARDAAGGAPKNILPPDPARTAALPQPQDIPRIEAGPEPLDDRVTYEEDVKISNPEGRRSILGVGVPFGKTPMARAIAQQHEHIEKYGRSTARPISPMVGAHVTGVKGALYDAPRPGRKHHGIDLTSTHPTVFAPISGTILVDRSQNGAEGCMVQILADDGNIYQFFHLKLGSIPAHWRDNQRVEAGEEIGTMGNTGYRKGGKPYPIHLHAEVRKPGNSHPHTYGDYQPVSAPAIYGFSNTVSARVPTREVPVSAHYARGQEESEVRYTVVRHVVGTTSWLTPNVDAAGTYRVPPSDPFGNFAPAITPLRGADGKPLPVVTSAARTTT